MTVDGGVRWRNGGHFYPDQISSSERVRCVLLINNQGVDEVPPVKLAPVIVGGALRPTSISAVE
jgi:hypothetical protein